MTDYTPQEQAKAMTADYLAERLDAAGNPPGFREAVESRLAERVEAIIERDKAQTRHLRSRGPNTPPTYYAHEEAPEDALQAAAAGARTAMAMAGEMVEPIPFERGAAQALAATAAWAIRSEAARVPRPPTRPANLHWSLPPVPWVEAENVPWPPPEGTGLVGRHQLTDPELTRCAEQPYADWVQLGLMERQNTFESRHSKQPSRQMLLAAGLETSNGQPTTRQLPFADSRPTIWSRLHKELLPSLTEERAREILATTAGPLAALLWFSEEPGAPDPDRGAGLHPFLLGPRIELVTLLGLRPEMPTMRLTLIDDNGPALVCRQWRGFLIDDGNYEPLEPALHGADLLLRSDLYLKLQATIGPDRVRLGISLTFWPDRDPSGSAATGLIDGAAEFALDRFGPFEE